MLQLDPVSPTKFLSWVLLSIFKVLRRLMAGIVHFEGKFSCLISSQLLVYILVVLWLFFNSSIAFGRSCMVISDHFFCLTVRSLVFVLSLMTSDCVCFTSSLFPLFFWIFVTNASFRRFCCAICLDFRAPLR